MYLKRACSAIIAAVLCTALLPLSASAADAYSAGDPTGDGAVDSLDAAAILVESAALGSTGISTMTDEQLAAADADRNGSADALDAADILVYSAAFGTGATTDDFETYRDKTNINLETLDTPALTVGRMNLAAKIMWASVPYASGYEIYRYDGASVNASDYKLIATVTGSAQSLYIDALSNNTDAHCYKVRAFRNQHNGTIYSSFSNAEVDNTKNAILNAADLEPHNSFTVYNRQGAETTSYTYTLSENDIAILEKFAVEHFPEGATREAQLWTTLYWIHKNVDYAYAGELWNSISGVSWTEAVFEKQLGQCAQYNGALAAMMAYLGYDVCMVQGYRGTWPDNYWQHFWPEVNIGGTTYMMECGNYGKSGNWYYFLETYNNTSKYICNQQNMS